GKHLQKFKWPPHSPVRCRRRQATEHPTGQGVPTRGRRTTGRDGPQEAPPVVARLLGFGGPFLGAAGRPHARPGADRPLAPAGMPRHRGAAGGSGGALAGAAPMSNRNLAVRLARLEKRVAACGLAAELPPLPPFEVLRTLPVEELVQMYRERFCTSSPRS